MAQATITIIPQKGSTAVPAGTPHCNVYANPGPQSLPLAHHRHVALRQSKCWPQWSSPVPHGISHHRFSSSWKTVCVDCIWLFELGPCAFAWWLRTETLESDSLDSKLGLSHYFLCDHEQVAFSLGAPVSPLLYPFDNVCVFSCFTCVQLFVALWTVAHLAPLSVWFSRQEQRSGLPCPPPGELPNRGIEPLTSCISCKAGGFFTTEPPGKPNLIIMVPISQVLMKITRFKTIIVGLHIMICVIKDYMSYYLSST